MIKRFFIFLIAGFIMLPLAVRADIIFEPRNDFYSRHRADCVEMRLNFSANGEIQAKREPGSDTVTAVFADGEVLHIFYVYNHRGESWGLCEFFVPGEAGMAGGWRDGWVLMDKLELVYDYFAFEKEHADKFYVYEGGYEKLRDADKIILWTYPGSGSISDIFEGRLNEELFTWNRTAYKDSDEREWLFMRYLQDSYFNIWICVSDPENPDIPGIIPELDIIMPERGSPVPWLVIILVAAVIAGTLILIRVFWKPGGDAE